MKPLTLAGALCCGLLTLPARAEESHRDPWWGTDKALHFGVSGVIAGAAYGASTLLVEKPWQRATAGAAFALTAGGAKELYDLADYGTASYKDMTFNLAGTAVGVLVALLIDLSLQLRDKNASRVEEAWWRPLREAGTH